MDDVEERLRRLGIREEDLEERFVLGSGGGGQKINKTASCVQLEHRPTGMEVTCQDTRSREKNREIARRRLCEHFENKAAAEKQERARARARRRFRNRRPSRAARARQRKQKEIRSEKKRFRGRVDE